MSEEQNIIFNIDVNVDDAKANIQELNKLFTTYLSLARRAGLPENLIAAMSRLQQARVAVQALIRSIYILYAASGPVGWIIGLGGLAVSGFMMVDMMNMRRPSY